MTNQVVLDLSDIKREVSIEAVARYFGGREYKIPEKSRGQILQGIEEAVTIAAPRAIYQLFTVSRKIPEYGVALDNGLALKLPMCLTDLETGSVAAVIGTLGNGLEDHCRELARTGEIYRSTLFDAVGTVLLDLLSEKISGRVQQESKIDGLETGKRFAPGINGYPLEQQHLLFRLVDHQSLGVFLNSSAVMVPTKSISFFLMMTKTGLNIKAEHKCGECEMSHCQFRLTSLH